MKYIIFLILANQNDISSYNSLLKSRKLFMLTDIMNLKFFRDYFHMHDY